MDDVCTDQRGGRGRGRNRRPGDRSRELLVPRPGQAVPPPRAFGLAWTPLYASIAWAAGHALRRTRGRQRNALAASLATNLAVNTAWNWMFFGLRSPRAGLAGTLLLDLSNAELIRRMARTDPRAAAALVPYALWCAFATILNADIARRNRRDPVRAG